MHTALGSPKKTRKDGACLQSVSGGEAGGSGVQGHPQLLPEFEATLSWVRLSKKEIKMLIRAPLASGRPLKKPETAGKREERELEGKGPGQPEPGHGPGQAQSPAIVGHSLGINDPSDFVPRLACEQLSS